MPEIALPTLGRVFDASTPASSSGIALTAPSSANTKAAWTQIVSSTSTAATGILVQVTLGPNATAANERALVDIGIGSAGSEQVIVADLSIEALWYGANYSPNTMCIHLPVPVAASTRIAARYQSSRSSAWGTCRVQVQLLGGGLVSPAMGIIETIGVASATSLATQIDPGGSANTKGSWTQIVASTAYAWHQMIVVVTSDNTDGAGNQQVAQYWSLDIATGASSSEQVILGDVSLSRWWSTALRTQVIGPIPISVPSGTRIAARCSSTQTVTTNGTRYLRVAVYGIG